MLPPLEFVPFSIFFIYSHICLISFSILTKIKVGFIFVFILNFFLGLKDQYRLLGENVAKLRTDLMKEQLSTFRSQLEDFARKHKVPSFFFWLFLIL